jgi:fructose-bisphosphate aldolase class II
MRGFATHPSETTSRCASNSSPPRHVRDDPPVTLVASAPLLDDALRGGYAVGAFNAIGLESIEAIVAAAEDARAPAIVQISENATRYASFTGLAAAALALARAAAVPVCVHFDHGTSVDACARALGLGCTSVMLDGSAWPFERNVAETRAAAERAHAAGASCEGEVGIVGGKGGEPGDGVLTDPEAGARFVELTGVDALACALGTRHGMVTKEGSVDLAHARRVHDAARVPLVLHGSSGVPDELLGELAAVGIAKVNLATDLNVRFSRELRERLDEDAAATDPRRYLAPARAAMRERVAELCALLGAAGRA